MAVDFKTFRSFVPFILKVKKPVLIRGRHGVGKSEVVYQIGADLKLKVVERRASQMTEGDLIGLPIIEDRCTKFNPPDWFKECCDFPRILFLDEVDRAVLEVRQGIFELTDSRKLNGHYLHPETLVFAAVNGGVHGAQYQVGEMDPAELDRWAVIDVEPSVEDWLDWAKTRVHSVLWDFVNQNRGHLEHKGEFEPHKVYPSRRSWDRYNECLSEGSLLKDDGKGSLSTVYELGCAFLGFEAAVSFRDFIQKYERQVTVDDILKGRLEKCSEWVINDYVAMCDKIVATDMFKSKMTDEDIAAIGKYALLAPGEALVKFWNQCSTGSPGANITRLHLHLRDRLLEVLNPQATGAGKAKKTP